MPAGDHWAPSLVVDTYLTTDDIAQALGVSKSTLYKWITTGRGPRVVKLPNGKYRAKQTWVDDWTNDLESDVLA